MGRKEKSSGVAIAPIKEIAVVDLFCGAGGLTHGFELAGLNVVAGIDADPDCEYPYTANNNAAFMLRDVAKLEASTVETLFSNYSIQVLAGCAPCQPFSRYGRSAKRHRGKWALVEDFGRIVQEIRPHIVTMENVPEVEHHPVFSEFVNSLEQASYSVAHGKLYCPNFGVPQGRSRMVLIASRLGQPELPEADVERAGNLCVRSALQALPALKAGDVDLSDPLHRACRLSQLNIERIRASSPGGTWREWPEDLRSLCHRAESGQTYPSVYGRMEWDSVSPTITTQFFGYGNGRFGHPEQDRALSIREGALLQTFPENYDFFPEGGGMSSQRLGKLIGNAVPVKLGESIGRSISNHVATSQQNRTMEKLETS